jgi:hypothetical protein
MNGCLAMKHTNLETRPDINVTNMCTLAFPCLFAVRATNMAAGFMKMLRWGVGTLLETFPLLLGLDNNDRQFP